MEENQADKNTVEEEMVDAITLEQKGYRKCDFEGVTEFKKEHAEDLARRIQGFPGVKDARAITLEDNPDKYEIYSLEIEWGKVV